MTTAVPVRVTWPVDLREAIHVELVGALPLDVAALLQQAYDAGKADAMRVLTDERRLSLLDTDWRQQAMAIRAQQLRHMEECAKARDDDRAAAENIAAGRHPAYRYRGGPVDWETGLPAGSACAWLRAKRRRDAELATVTPIRATTPSRARPEAA